MKFILSKNLKQMLTKGEVCTVLDVSIPTLDKLIRVHRLPCVRIGRRMRFNPNDIEKWLKEHSEESQLGDKNA
jgi:excisionase family DNA binding protein